METEIAGKIPDEILQNRNINESHEYGSMDASELVESLLSNKHVPEKLQRNLWVLFGKSTKLSFLKQADIDNLMNQFELLRMTIIESIPKNAYNEVLELELIQIRMEFELNLKRSQGSRMNERELLGSSTTASFTEKPMGVATENLSFLDKITNMFR